MSHSQEMERGVHLVGFSVDDNENVVSNEPMKSPSGRQKVGQCYES